jgi:hypothetical protein
MQIHVASVVLERPIPEVEPHELLGREARDGDAADRPRPETVRRVLECPFPVTRLVTDAFGVERDRMQVDRSPGRRLQDETDRPQVQSGKVAETTQHVDRPLHVR